MKSARRAKSFRLVSDGVVPRSRTITRTIPMSTAVSTRQCGPPCSFKRRRRRSSISASNERISSSNRPVNVRSSRRSSSLCRRTSSSGRFACSCFCFATNSAISFGWIGHDAVGLRVPGTGRGGFRIRIRSSKPHALPLGQFTRKYRCGLLNNRLCTPQGFLTSSQSSPSTSCSRPFAHDLAQFPKSCRTFPSDCLPDVLPQVSDSAEFAGECPCLVRVLERSADAN
jgi:hypothetical protein